MAAVKKVMKGLDMGMRGLMLPMALFSFYSQVKQGDNIFSAGAKTIFDFGIMTTPGVWAQLAYAGMRQMGKSALTKEYQIRRRTMPFGRGTYTDTQEAAQSRQILYQSAIAAQSGLRLSGHSFSGFEGALLHRRYNS